MLLGLNNVLTLVGLLALEVDRVLEEAEASVFVLPVVVTVTVVACLRRDEAKAEIDAYRQQQERMNEKLESTLVEQNLVEVGELEAQVDDSFQGADQALKQNRFSKTTQADALKTRRSGSKK